MAEQEPTPTQDPILNLMALLQLIMKRILPHPDDPHEEPQFNWALEPFGEVLDQLLKSMMALHTKAAPSMESAYLTFFQVSLPRGQGKHREADNYLQEADRQLAIACPEVASSGTWRTFHPGGAFDLISLLKLCYNMDDSHAFVERFSRPFATFFTCELAETRDRHSKKPTPELAYLIYTLGWLLAAQEQYYLAHENFERAFNMSHELSGSLRNREAFLYGKAVDWTKQQLRLTRTSA